jgi:GntR family transcriptional regulator of arabinose operon
VQPKYQVIAAELRARILAGVYNGVKMLPTENSLMDDFSVSRQTIRQALSVLVEEGYISKRRGSGSYIRLATEPRPAFQRRTVAVVTTYISNYIFPSILREIVNVLSQKDCIPQLFATNNRYSMERAILQNLLECQPDGIIIEGTKTALPNPNLDLLQQLLDRKIPLVFINGNYSRLRDAVAVLDDNEGGGKMLVDYLVNKGHRKIAGIFKFDDIQGHGRYAGYTEGLKLNGILPEDDLVFWYSTASYSLMFHEPVITRFIKLWKSKGCTAIVCYNDEIACSLLPHINKYGLSVPGDFSLVSFDNSYLSEISSTRITSLSHGQQNAGGVAAKKLLSIMNGEEAESESLSWEIVERDSG